MLERVDDMLEAGNRRFPPRTLQGQVHIDYRSTIPEIVKLPAKVFYSDKRE